MKTKKKSRTSRPKRLTKSPRAKAAKVSATAKSKTRKVSVSGHGARVGKPAPVASAREIVKDLGISKKVIDAARRALSA